MNKAFFDNGGVWWSNKLEDMSFVCDGAKYTLSLGYVGCSDPYEDDMLYLRLFYDDGSEVNSFIVGRYVEDLDHEWLDAHPNVRSVVVKEAERIAKLKVFE